MLCDYGPWNCVCYWRCTEGERKEEMEVLNEGKMERDEEGRARLM